MSQRHTPYPTSPTAGRKNADKLQFKENFIYWNDSKSRKCRLIHLPLKAAKFGEQVIFRCRVFFISSQFFVRALIAREP